MGTASSRAEAVTRGARMLRTALGPAIAAFLEDPAVVEVMLNPDGRLWIDRLSDGPCRHRRACLRRPMASASSASSRITSAPRSMPAVRASRPSCPKRASGSRDCCRPSSRRRPSRSASPPSRSSRSTTMSRAGIMTPIRPRCCAKPSPSAATSSSPAAPRPARPRSPMRCSPRSPRPTTASC